ncbi:MAG TPA: NAD-dependent epimerase/dehydratase family protein [Chthoniobacterales bacterium]|jgi:nucleoside-diphosphate-sugar epimerase|nr:NAD-dependent epimerase/dehydratase family protein [Chthoniobacterales bacterium]
MARILIAGCGYVGAAAGARFHGEGWEVEGWTGTLETAAKLSLQPFAVRAVDISNSGAVSTSAGKFDVVIHCVSSRGGTEEEYRALYLEGAKNLLRRFPEATVIFTGSTSVYAQTNGEIVDETSPAKPLHEKGKILRATEETVLAARGIVARLGGIHGPGRSHFLSRFLEGGSIGGGNDNRFINQIHRDDIVEAMVILANREAECPGEIYNVVADEPVTAREAYEWLCKRLEKRGAKVAEGGKQSRRGETNKRVSNRKLKELGWRPLYPTFESAMTKSILPSFGF